MPAGCVQIPSPFSRHMTLIQRLAPSALVLFVLACGDSRDMGTGPSTGNEALTVTDEALRQAVTARSAWAFFRNNANRLSRSAGSGHSEPQLRTQYNPRAAAMLDANGRVRAGATFPDSSIIVKELFSGGTLTTLAVMMKLRGSPQASRGEWIWGYYDAAGGMRASVTNRGSGCAGCHESGLDYTRMNDSHP